MSCLISLMIYVYCNCNWIWSNLRKIQQPWVMQTLCQLKVICKFISRHEQWTACKTCRLSVSGDFLIISVGSCWGPPWLTNNNICLFMTLCLYSDFLLYCIHKVEHKTCITRPRFIVFFLVYETNKQANEHILKCIG